MKPKKIDFIEFAEKFFYVRNKDNSVSPIRLEQWQIDNFIRPVFYDLTPDGLRKYDLAVFSVPKKNGKSTLAALCIAYLLLADGEQYPEIISLANDLEQARRIFDFVKRSFELSPVLRQEVVIKRDRIEARNGGWYQVISADSVSAHGYDCSAIVIDEMWGFQDYKLLEAVAPSPARRNPLTLVVTYAGNQPFPGNPLFDYYERGKEGKDPKMYFYWSHENLASWVDDQYLESEKKRLPEFMFKRLHRNQWTVGSDNFLTKEDVDASIDPELRNRDSGQGERFTISCDLGLRSDRTVISVVHRNWKSGRIILDHVKSFEGKRGAEVNIADVESHLIHLWRNFRQSRLVIDPWQSIGLIQRLKARNVKIEEFVFSGGNLTKMTEALLGVFKDRTIKIFKHDELIKELLTVMIIETSYGLRIDHKSNMHDDFVIALGMGVFTLSGEPTRIYTQKDFQSVALF
ncbi:MAG: hypothetical protein JW984_16165 [Deltaproteobacteria bacterium]|uniref:Terminase large subunit-like ATPase domain-containing protein n=1 Tax=Candidatus Zymogenus saltonus TaxID=2844893 RepID=A0A9D8KHX6_9DELT|nr:hypothetical protein [Candidatus Zymogenus saltonus]